MPQQLLDSPQVGAFLQHVRSKSVTQSVRMDVRRKSARHRHAFHDAPYAAGRQPSAAMIHQQRRRRFLQPAKQLMSERHMFFKSKAHPFPEGRQALLATFSSHQNDSRRVPHIFQINAHQLGVADAAAVQQFQNQRVSLRKFRLFRSCLPLK